MNWFWSILLHPATLLSLGGAAGANARFWLSLWLQHVWEGKFPMATMVVNVSGSLLLGVAAVVCLERLPENYRAWYLVLGVGFCGSYTTFSTFALENARLLRDGMWGYLAINIGVSLAATLTAAILGMRGAERAFVGR